MTKKVIRDSKTLAYPGLKIMFDTLFLIGIVLLAAKLGVLLLNKVASLDISLIGGRYLWNFGPLFLMIVGGSGSNILKEKYKAD